MCRQSKQSGFSVIELLLVVAVIGILAALAVPNLTTSEKAAHEASAISYMRHWSAAQELYRIRHGHYADADQQLVSEGFVGNPDPDRFGYIFSIDNPAGSADNWWGSAVPKSPGTSGDRYFYIDRTGVIRYSTSGPANGSSTPLGKTSP